MSANPHTRRSWAALGVLLVSLLAGCAMPGLEGVAGSQAAGPPAATGQAGATPTPAATATPLEPTVRPTATAVPTATARPTETPTPAASPTPVPTATPIGPTPDGQARTVQVPILMYHYVSEPPPGSDVYRLDLSVSPRQFEEQLVYLQKAGYASVTLDDLMAFLATGRPLPPKPIILTFDDGYIDAYTGALPLLQRYGYRGTFFVITRALDEGRAGYLSWAQAAEMQAKGMDIEAHSASHPDLRGLGEAALRAEVLGAREAIEAHLNKPVRFFCYPSGRYDAATIAALRAAGYWAAVTTAGGAQHSSTQPFELKRVRIHGDTSVSGLKALLDYYLE